MESVDGGYVDISVPNPLSVISYRILLEKTRNSQKSLINMKNHNNKCFHWYHVSNSNPVDENQQEG